MHNTLEFTAKGTVGVIMLRRPEKRNALNRAMAAEFLQALDQAATLRALVITGGHNVFSAGADLTEGWPAESTGPSMPQVLERLAAWPVPTIAAIEGYCLGGGLELALCCDLRVAGASARFGTPEVLRGLLPGAGGTQRLPRLVGPARAKELMYFGDQIDAASAERWGLINRMVEPGESCAEALRMAERLARGAPLALREIKRLVDSGMELELPAALDLEGASVRSLLGTDDVQEGVRAFQERRPPVFRGQ